MTLFIKLNIKSWKTSAIDTVEIKKKFIYMNNNIFNIIYYLLFYLKKTYLYNKLYLLIYKNGF